MDIMGAQEKWTSCRYMRGIRAPFQSGRVNYHRRQGCISSDSITVDAVCRVSQEAGPLGVGAHVSAGSGWFAGGLAGVGKGSSARMCIPLRIDIGVLVAIKRAGFGKGYSIGIAFALE